MIVDRATFLATALLAPIAQQDPFAAIERRRGGVLGVVAIDLKTGRRLVHRDDERFPLASTWKLPLVMTVLARVDAGRDGLDRALRFGKADLEPPFSTIAERYPAGGTMTLGEICRLTIADSDNTGADLLARRVGGPSAVTAYLRSIGMRDVRVDRFERQLTPRASRAEARDTATPDAMAALVARLATNSPLSRGSTALLLRWMRAATTGAARLRAGVPAGWHVADKTGTYENAANDVGLLLPPTGGPIAIACYTFAVPNGGSAAIADVARLVADTLRPVSGR